MKITCPFCGARNENEFHRGGEAHIARPQPSMDTSDDVWGEYLFFRDNPKGIIVERWRHTYGCGQWFNVTRDTVTHEIKAVYDIEAPKPAIDAQ